MIIALVMAECAVAIAFVGMRFYSRNMIKGLGSDDWLMLATLVSPYEHPIPNTSDCPFRFSS